jgi:hypothetical protein
MAARGAPLVWGQLFGVSVHFISKWHYLNPEAK